MCLDFYRLHGDFGIHRLLHNRYVGGYDLRAAPNSRFQKLEFHGVDGRRFHGHVLLYGFVHYTPPFVLLARTFVRFQIFRQETFIDVLTAGGVAFAFAVGTYWKQEKKAAI